MKKVCLILLLVFAISLILSACDPLNPNTGGDFYFGGDINLDTSRRPDDGGLADEEPEAGIGDNSPTDLPYLPLA
ncbi:MAG: hypothetical protein IJ009_05315 [Clostridia bacterium]|nr:hypothetical protein [Clostridia bacterium]